MNGTVILNFLVVVILGDQVIKFLSIFASPKKILHRNQSLGAPALWAFWAQVSFERLTPKRARKLRCGTQKWARKLNSSRNYGTELNHRCGKLAPSPLACFPISHLILLPCACFIGYTYRILHGKCGRTVFSYELLTSDMKRVRFLIQKQRSRENRT